MANFMKNLIKPVNKNDWELLKSLVVRNATEKEIEELEDEGFIDPEEVVDFNLVIPMPEDMNIEANGRLWITRDNPMKEKQDRILEPLLSKVFKPYMTQHEFIENAIPIVGMKKSVFQEVYNCNSSDVSVFTNTLASYYNQRKYGFTSWYKWCIKNWGTKWNAYLSDVSNDYTELTFDTAWTIPEPVFIEISKKCPIYVVYAGEDMGEGYGIVKYENGNNEIILDNSNKSRGERYACANEDIDNLEDDLIQLNWQESDIKVEVEKFKEITKQITNL